MYYYVARIFCDKQGQEESCIVGVRISKLTLIPLLQRGRKIPWSARSWDGAILNILNYLAAILQKIFLGLWMLRTLHLWKAKTDTLLVQEFCAICCTEGERFETGNGVTFQGESGRESDYANYHQICHCNHHHTSKSWAFKIDPRRKIGSFSKTFLSPFWVLFVF